MMNNEQRVLAHLVSNEVTTSLHKGEDIIPKSDQLSMSMRRVRSYGALHTTTQLKTNTLLFSENNSFGAQRINAMRQ